MIDLHYRSRDGFASFYNDFANNWKTKPFNQWDEKELSLLMMITDIHDEVFEDFNCNGEISGAITTGQIDI